jgi:galactokinase
MEIEVAQLSNEFRDRFGSTPRFFQAPGRVNLIGEHTDYNEGFVMPFAINRRAVVAAASRDDSTLRVYARDLDEEVTIDLRDEPVMRRGMWVDYVEGIYRILAQRSSNATRGADMILTSTVPIGAGLSSSAAIEMALGLAILGLNGEDIDRKMLALAGQRVEHEFVGTRSGVMDQFTSVFARRGNAMLLDCRSLEIEYVPIEFKDVAIAVVDSKIKHDLASSEYNTRREECETGVAILREHISGVTSLRDVTKEELDRYSNLLPETIARRCRHVVTENARTLAAASAFRNSDVETAGTLMSESHASLRDDYEVSCAELDRLVDTALSVNGVYGARMTGGGFGGCTVNLVRRDAIEEFRRSITSDYRSEFGHAPEAYTFQPTDGASEMIL